MMKKVLFVLMMVLSASMAVAMEQTPVPEIVVQEGSDAWVIGAYGEGEVHLFKDGEEVENPYTVEITFDEQCFYFEAYAEAEGCLPSEWVGEYVYVPQMNPPIIEPLPDFNLIVTDEYAYLEFHDLWVYSVAGVCVNGVLFNPPYVFPRWEEDYYIYIDVCFSEEGYNDIYVGRDYVVPALEGAPHDMNSDGRVNIDDVTALILYLLTLNTEGFNVEKADVDCDGQINIDDVTELINRLLNIPPW